MATPAEYADAAWKYHLVGRGGMSLEAGHWLTGANENAFDALGKLDSIAGQLSALTAEVSALKAVSDQILAAIQGAEFPVTGTVHIGT